MGNEVEKTLEIVDYMDRLSNISRYPMWDKIRVNNVSEHSFRVAMLCMMIADMTPKTGRLDFAILMRKALLHDFGEALMGDITYRVKHRDEETLKFFEHLEGTYIDEMFEQTPFYRNYAKHCKEGIEGKVVAVADMFDNIIYGVREVRMGNNSMLVLVKRCVEYIVRDTRDTIYDFIGHTALRMLKEVEGYASMSEHSRQALEDRYGTRP